MVERSEAARLLDAMLADLDRISEAMVGRIRREIPSFGRVPISQHRADTRAAAAALIRSQRPGAEEQAPTEGLAELGSRRAQQGIPVEDALRAWRISIELGTTEASRIAREQNLDPSLVFGFFQEVLEAADQAMVALADAYRSTDEPVLEAAELRREQFTRSALAGELEASELRERAADLGLDIRVRYRAFRIPETSAGTEAALRRALGGAGSEARSGCFVTDGAGITGFLSGELDRGVAELVAFGPPADLVGLALSDRIAARVGGGARSFGLKGIHTLASAGVYVAVAESPDIGAALAARYVEPVRQASSGEEILASVREWFGSTMKVGAAAKRLHIHPNTLRYRLKRYAELTGSDLGETEQAVAAWLALQNDLISR